MTRKNGKNGGDNPFSAIPHDTRRAIIVVLLVVAGLFLTLAAFDAAGIAGSDAYRLFASLLGVGYFLLPLLFFVLAGNALRAQQQGFTPVKLIASGLFFVAGLGFIQVVSGKGGLLGAGIGDLAGKYLDIYAALVVLGGLSLISLLLLLEGRISLEPIAALWRGIKSLTARLRGTAEEAQLKLGGFGLDNDGEEPAETDEAETDDEDEPVIRAPRQEPGRAGMPMQTLKSLLGTYTPPPLSLLERDRGRPGVGDIKGNANIIKRTLQNFGITVELDEISIGPSVTRYAVKPAEGVRLQKILTLQKNLELALSASSVRIEAPIPGKSLVGIEVPNSSKVTVGLGAMLDTPDFADSHKPLLIGL